jgi:hypothetical protein
LNQISNGSPQSPSGAGRGSAGSRSRVASVFGFGIFGVVVFVGFFVIGLVAILLLKGAFLLAGIVFVAYVLFVLLLKSWQVSRRKKKGGPR